MSSDSFDPLVDQAPSRFIVGVDLGTTNSAVTWFDTEDSNGTIQVLPIPQLVAPHEIESLQTLPSFHFQPPRTGNEVGESLKLPWDRRAPRECVGAYARDETARTSGRGIASAKSWLCHAAVDRTSALLPWHGSEDVQRFSPVEISGKYLRHVRHAWDAKFPDHPLTEQDLVLTLPASFDEIARELTIAAAAQAGLERVVLIEEPQAAFYSWVDRHAADWESRVSVGQKILVCDIGGGTTDFTLIRVRPAVDGDDSGTARVQFHRVAVGQHLILGGDNLDLAVARHLEQKLSPDQRLHPYQWDVLVGSSRQLKEQLLAGGAEEESATLHLPGRGSSLLGGSLSTEVTAAEIRELVFNGFLPRVELAECPSQHASGFRELGLPYASDPAITRHLAEFLTTHARAGDDPEAAETSDRRAARPDVVLFNGGFFESPLLRQRVIDQLMEWFSESDQEPWQPEVLDPDRLDLAVARGASYYGLVRRDRGVRIAASLARSYYLSIGGQPEQAICLLPGNAEPGQTFELDREFALTISQPVEFSLLVSSTRLADHAGAQVAVEPDQMRRLPPIRTALQARSRNEKRDVPVRLEVGLTEIGTMDLSCQEIDQDRRWKLQFDVRSATQTEMEAHSGVGESQGYVDESVWQDCQTAIAAVFGPDGDQPPRDLMDQLVRAADMPRDQWPMSLLRRIWATLMEFESGRRRSAAHEARWLNLLGYALRPGYAVALDDWRVTETWRSIQGKLVHGQPRIRTESLILWRRLSGGLSRGQQLAIADPLMAALRTMVRKMRGQKVKPTAVVLRPEESVEIWRLLGSLEWLPVAQKIELGEMILATRDRSKLAPARDAMVWALGRIGQRTPMYGPLNSVVPSETVGLWLSKWLDGDLQPGDALAVVQMSRLTEDRYRDLEESIRRRVLDWLEDVDAGDHLRTLVQDGGSLDTEQQGKVFGDALPQGLKLTGV